MPNNIYSERAKIIISYMEAMGWCNSLIRGKKQWVKVYPAPSEIPAEYIGQATTIAYYGDEVWDRDKERARVMAIEDGRLSNAAPKDT